MKVRFYLIDKRVISTYRPGEELDYAEFDFNYKKPTDYLNPVILIDTGGMDVKSNYAVIYNDQDIIIDPDTGEESYRISGYYFISNVTYSNYNIMEIHLELDYLATTKDDILASAAYVIYSSNKFNRWVKDDRTPIVARPPEVTRTSSTPIINDNAVFVGSTGLDVDDEVVILTTYSQDVGIAHWAITEGWIDVIMDALIRAGGSIQGSMQMLFGDALGSIISAIRLPIKKECLPTDNTFRTIYLGDYALQISQTGYAQAEQLSRNYIYYRDRVGIPTTYLDYRVFEPYVTLKLVLPFVGVVDIPHNEFAGSIYYDFNIELLTGKITYTIYNDENYNHYVASFSGQCGGNIPIAASQIANATELVKSLATSGLTLGAAAINPTLGIVSSIGGIASAFYHSQQKTTNVLGSYSGGYAELNCNKIYCIAFKYETACEPGDLTDLEGRPVMDVLELSECEGFVRTQGFQLKGGYFKTVKDTVNAMLDAGIYIE